MTACAALYRELLEGAREELVAVLGRHRYRLWFRDAEVVRVSGLSVTLAVPTGVHRTWLECTYRSLLDRAFGRVLGEGVHVEIVVSERLDSLRVVRDAIPDDEAAWRAVAREVHPPPTLLSFVPSAPNAFALRLVEQVLHGSDAGAPSLYVFGDAGSGKTHVVRALHAAMTSSDETAALFLPARALTARVVAAVRDDDAEAPRRLEDDLASRRAVFVDGLDELASRPATQRALERLLDRARAHGVGVVIAGRVHPRSLAGLSERLRSRLMAGLLVRLVAPDEDARARILDERAASAGYALPKAVRDAIVHRAPSLGGSTAIVDRWAYASRRAGQPLDARWIDEIAPAASPTSPREEVIRRAKDAVCAHFGIPRRALDRPTKHPSVLEARRIAMYLVWRSASLPLGRLAEGFGLRSHSAASRALAEIRARREVDPALETTLDGLVARL